MTAPKAKAKPAPLPRLGTGKAVAGLAGYEAQVNDVLERSEIGDDDLDQKCAATMLALSSFVGPRVAARLGRNRFGFARANPIAARLRANGVWVGRCVEGNWFDEETGGCSFLLDVMVGVGLVERSG